MPNYQSPGVYVEEINSGTKPIEAAGSSVAAFVGFTEKAERIRDNQSESLLYKPTLVTNWSQYTQLFGGFADGIYTPDSVYGYFANGGGRCYIVSLQTVGDPDVITSAEPAQVTIASTDENTPLLNFRAREEGPSGNALRVEVRLNPAPEVPDDDDDDDDSENIKTSVVSREQTFDVIISRGSRTEEQFRGLTLKGGARNVETVIKTQSKVMTVTVAPQRTTDVQPLPGIYSLEGGAVKTKAVTVKEYLGSSAERTGLGGLEPLEEVSMICVPDLMSSYEQEKIDLKGVQAVQQSIVDFCEHVKYCFAILDTPPNMMPQEAKQWRLDVNYDSSRAALYYPWIEIADQTGANGRTRVVPPSGHIAGIYARTDETRGVHKAPANEVIRGALGLEVQMTRGENDELNPIGVNAIRSFPGRGIRVWGARTLSSDASWRYINVRRLFNMVEKSIEDGIQWVVFEPNDSNLWARVRRDISAFLKLVWRSGALFGTTPEQAFYVKCDEETNPHEVRDAGQLIIEVGLSPVKPAEFVIFRIAQWAGPDAASE